MRILYLVHDLNDAAVARRISMLRRGGAEVELAGFFRGEAAPAEVEGAAVLSLGRSFDAQLARRARSVAGLLAGARGLASRLRTPDLVLARNLEMLAVGHSLARRFAARPEVVYECLDIHRLMLGRGAKTLLLRALERRLLSRTPLALVSSPAFRDRYFVEIQRFRGEVMLVENRTPAVQPATRVRRGGPPWRIGWFGMLRCARSLAILADLAARCEGRIEVVLAGKPARTELCDFDAAVASPHVRYLGPYAAADLPRLYADIDLVWAIDYFEEGLNSNWLLPNRLYEGCAHGAVPIALRSVETGRWLAARNAGLLIDDPAADLPAFLAGLDPQGLARLRAEVEAIPDGDLMFADAECRDLVRALQAVSGSHVP